MQFLTRALSSGGTWAIRPHALEELQQLVASRGLPEAPDTGAEPQAAERVPMARNPGRQVAVLTFHGTVVSRAPRWAQAYGYISPQNFAAEVRALADDPTVSAIAVWCDSPGGTVAGTVEAAEAVAYARGKKRVTFACADMTCSAAYWIASQATEIVVTPTALVGSIGVITVHADYSGMLGSLGVVVSYIRSAAKKALGQPYESLSEEARAERQEMVDAIHTQFVQAVAKGRRKARNVVAEQWATGHVWTGQDAVTAGLADRVASLGQVLAELTGNAAPPESPAPPDDEEDPEAQTTPSPAATGDPEPPDAEQTSPTEEPPPDPEAASSIDPTTAPSAQEAQTMNIAAISAKLAAGEKLTAEERRFLNDHLGTEEGAAAVAPSGSTTPSAGVDPSSLSPEVRALLDQATARAESAERTANTERDTRLNREFRERALALGQPAAFGATLRAAHEKLSAEEYQALEQSLNATGAQMQLLGESGSSQDDRSAGGSTGSVQAEYASRVEAAMKADPKLSRAAAGQKVMRDDPAFAARYRGR
ncbi:S49 family peptidase [Deinococcus apachensis]|uniref:S49 family peptidase n=1 Tax=Deinococcus apachensis TaxID=309886 RepID=UPI0003802012|nr:S49 family peptidase [Deinococcus apachensis]